MPETKYVIIGGGIAGVTCAETLSLLAENSAITLISASPLIKTISNLIKVTPNIESFDVKEQPFYHFKEHQCRVEILHTTVTSLCAKEKKLFTSDGPCIEFDKLCICTGGKPKVIAPNNQYVIGIRDTESVKEFQKKISSARKVMIVGNGGIATELVYELEGCEVIWAIKDKSIAHTFVDAGAGEFFLAHLNKVKDNAHEGPSKRLKYTTNETCEAESSRSSLVMGSALGPDWAAELDIRGSQQISHSVFVEYEVEVDKILSSDEVRLLGLMSEVTEQDLLEWPVFVLLTNSKIYGCDLIVSATGVEPFTDIFLLGNSFDLALDGGLKVNSKMETSEPNIFAAGDVCTASWDQSPHWLQMRLWSQARQMGCYAAKCMLASAKGEDISMDFCFELFAHMTTFFNFKVILLGQFNAQKLPKEYEVLLRCTKGVEYVKAILYENKLVGAVLIGETDLEETFENLILNGLDLSAFKDHLLEPGIDVDDFFD